MCMILIITVMESLEYLIHLASIAYSDVTTHAQGITKWKDNQVFGEYMIVHEKEWMKCLYEINK